MTERNSTRAPVLNQAKKMGRPPKSTATYIKQAKAVHGERFIYDAVSYKNNTTKIDIECREHGIFSQRPTAHLKGQGCPTCARLIVSKKKTKAEFIADAEAVHGKGRYDYSKAVYKGNKVKVEIICNQCNESFYPKPNNHITLKSGCPKCVFKNTWLTQDEFVRRCIETHGHGAYDYSKAIYTRGCDRVLIGCNTCGQWFEQQAGPHTRGTGCPQCSTDTKGYSRSSFSGACERNNGGNGVLYVIKCFSGSESFYKVGITSTSTGIRFTTSNMPYKYGVLYEVVGSGSYIFDLETSLHRTLRNKQYNPKIDFGGSVRECFTTIEPVEPLLKELSTTEQLQLLA